MIRKKVALALCVAAALLVCACSRQQSDWQKTRAANTAEAYELFLKKYPRGEFSPQAEARVKELYEEQRWEQARDADTLDAYQAFIKQYPEGKWAEEARIRIENFTLPAAPANAAASPVPDQPPGDAQRQAPAAAQAAVQARKSPAPARAADAPPAPQVAAARGGAAGYGVQLGAFKSGAAAANRHWAHLAREYPQLLAGLSPKVTSRKGTAGTLYRLQVADLTEKRASSLCKSLQAHAQACELLHPRSG